MSAELLASDAWRDMGIYCRRFVDALLLEHCNNAGRENGRLVATYAQLAAAGLKRQRIKAAIDEAVERGLVKVMITGGLHGIEVKRTPSQYRLTWLGCIGPAQPATDEWRGYKKHFPSPPIGHPIGPPIGHPTEIEGKEIRHSRKRRRAPPWGTASRSTGGGSKAPLAGEGERAAPSTQASEPEP